MGYSIYSTSWMCVPPTNGLFLVQHFQLLKFYYSYSLGSVSLGLEEGDFTGEMPNSK